MDPTRHEEAATRCPNCGASLAPDWDVNFMGHDRDYFEQHPFEKRYCRLPLPGEHPFIAECSGRLMIVEVTLVAPGLRTRAGYEIAVPIPTTAAAAIQ